MYIGQLYRWCYYPSPFPFRAYDNAPGRYQLYRFWIKYGAVLHEYSVPGANLQRIVLPTYDHTRLLQKQFYVFWRHRMNLFTYFEYFRQYNSILYFLLLKLMGVQNVIHQILCLRGGEGGSSKGNSKLFVMFSTWKRLELFATIATSKRQANDGGSWVMMYTSSRRK